MEKKTLSLFFYFLDYITNTSEFQINWGLKENYHYSSNKF